MKIKPVGHDDLIKRIQNSAITAGMPEEIAAGIGKEWNDFDKMQGHRRVEVAVPVKSVVSFAKWIFKLFRRK